ncbi:heme d1 biosynthesis radical SAM protein NirJ [Laribacter hongkongensis]|uniref:heme d1 biosynthesis radical SAM protein NirJ n=1 Tax=Laribacter hongkongensis TaxID=168471 RepID=UPI001EFCDB9C|nr:heme d1 biosynthesis radical SAM protein NirJ [Laribacter hongkongensis]MCG9083879.1 heme d1 biosynthesis radical SAM protein NirJ [Laribacter hongkongensis]
MLRLTRYLQLLHRPGVPDSQRPAGPQQAPVVIWNLIRRCNLTCQHCYSTSADRDFAGELTTREVHAVMDDLKAFGVQVLILSGGEPLLRPDILEVGKRAKEMGFYVGLSSNGTLIDGHNVAALAETGFDYIGISLDGIGETHDRFRRLPGGFGLALRGVRLARDAGMKVGIRYTMTEGNAQDLPALLQLVADENIDKFYFSHLNYAGRGNKHRADDARRSRTRWAMDQLIRHALVHLETGRLCEFVTGNNDADGVYLLHWVRRHYPERAGALHAALRRWGGNASGTGVANIDNLGNVHPDTMWWKVTLGNVRERPFSTIWQDLSHPLMAGLRQSPRPVTGRCGACAYLGLCNGNTRVRAWELTGDYWAADPACYLGDEEIGIESGSHKRPEVTHWHRGIA